jgi:DNA-binding FadR family transcriptional regulator
MSTTPAVTVDSRKPRLIDSVALRLRERIVSGEWPIGSKIPTEPELTTLLGVGRNTVREAVQSLVHGGLLERKQGSGTYVRSTSELATAMTRELSGADQRDVLEVRQTLEVRAAALAAQRRTPHEVAQMRVLVQARADAVKSGDLDEMVATDMRLHRFIAACSKNPLLAELYETVLSTVRSNIAFNFQQIVVDSPAHESIVQAIVDGDPARAALEVQDYLHGMVAFVPPDDTHDAGGAGRAQASPLR